MREESTPEDARRDSASRFDAGCWPYCKEGTRASVRGLTM